MSEPYPYCIHGSFVGGCGIDHMCFACEMGDEPTKEEEAEYDRRVREWRNRSDQENFWNRPASVLDGPY